MDCKTKYPLFLIHGTGFRDRKHLNYWGRIPAILIGHGARIFYGHQDSWGSIEGNTAILKKTLSDLIQENGCEKVNIIAHSKGGLEARHLAADPECREWIASITTISTPHHGSETMDLLDRLPSFLFQIASFFMNLFCRLLGDKHPDFKRVCKQFTTGYAKDFNAAHPDIPGIYYQSYAAAMHRSRSDLLMWLPHMVVKRIEGENDGLVAAVSAKWGHFRGVWYSSSNRGISHADSVDLRRRPFSRQASGEGITDITDAYVELVHDLRNKGF